MIITDRGGLLLSINVPIRAMQINVMQNLAIQTCD